MARGNPFNQDVTVETMATSPKPVPLANEDEAIPMTVPPPTCVATIVKTSSDVGVARSLTQKRSRLALLPASMPAARTINSHPTTKALSTYVKIALLRSRFRVGVRRLSSAP